MSQMSKMIDRAQRYLVIDHSLVDVNVQASDYADVDIVTELLDISTGGAKLRSREQIPQGEQLSLKLTSDQFAGSICVDATVCWVQLTGVGEWLLGCAFEPQIPQPILDQLAKSGAFDRREDGRREVCIESRAAWELASDTDSVCVVNISTSGFCLVSPQPGKPGAQVLVKFSTGLVEATISGRCRWQVETKTGFALGCEFSSSQDYMALLEIEKGLSPEKRGLFRRLFSK